MKIDPNKKAEKKEELRIKKVDRLRHLLKREPAEHELRNVEKDAGINQDITDETVAELVVAIDDLEKRIVELEKKR